jgi:hypothetical protein
VERTSAKPFPAGGKRKEVKGKGSASDEALTEVKRRHGGVWPCQRISTDRSISINEI